MPKQAVVHGSCEEVPLFLGHAQYEEVGAFALWALCGYWNGPKRINYSSEPDPEEITEISEAFSQSMSRRRIQSLEHLTRSLPRIGIPKLLSEVADPAEYPKSARRLQAGLQQLLDKPESIAEVTEMLPTTTYDEVKVEELMQQLAEMAPALDLVRCSAIDAGFY